MRCTHRNPHLLGHKQGQSPGGFGTNPLQRRHLGDLGAHGFDDFPTTAQGAQTDRRITGQRNPVRHVLDVLDISVGHHRRRNDPHHLLGIVAPVSHTERRR